MKILRMSGALGNQMVKYAVYLALKKNFPTEDIVIDDRIYEVDHFSGKMVLNKIFGIEYDRYDDCIVESEAIEREKVFENLRKYNEEEASIKYIEYIANKMEMKKFSFYRQYGEKEKGIVSSKQIKRNKNKLLGFSKSLFKKNSRVYDYLKDIYTKNIIYSKFNDIYVDEAKCFSNAYREEIIKKRENAYYYCHWEQHDYWFRSAEEEVRKAFVFPSLNEPKNQEVAQYMLNSNSISVHIRRNEGLYANSELFEKNYYYKSNKYIKKLIKKPVFFIFAIDIEWCRKNMKTLGFEAKDEVYFIDWNQDRDYNCKVAFRDMQLMSVCKHNIIANSTFSFMGAYLNKNQEKIVCCSKEFGTRGFVNIMEK